MTRSKRVAFGTAQYGLNVIGHASGNFGLSVACRNTIRLLLSLEQPVRLVDVDAGSGRSGHDLTYADLEDRKDPTPYGVNLFHMNPPDIINLMVDRPRLLDLPGRMNVCVPFWELPKLPKCEWVAAMESCDLILCPSQFILDTITTSAPNARCIHYPQTVYIPDPEPVSRTRWGLREDAVTFLVSLDLGSDVGRKNPFASINAFRQAFGDDHSVQLALKLNNPRMGSEFSKSTDQLEDLTKDLTNVVLITESLSYSEVIDLYNACDVICSLHRSEGLGLHLLEAMMLGKPAIATAWSGNMDFMDEESSCLVGYDFLPVESTHASYAPEVIGEGQFWAEPRLEEAVGWMRRLAEDEPLRRTLGAAARTRALATQSNPERRAAIDMLQSQYADAAARLQDHQSRAGSLSALRSIPLERRIRRYGGRTLSRLGLRK